MEIFAFVLYFAAMLAIGVVFFFKSKSGIGGEKDYFLGGRSMGPFVTAMSAQASDMSGWLLMGLPGSILAFGLGKAWIGIGLGLGTMANWIFVARRLRRFSAAADDAITLPQYFSNRFASSGNTLKVICAIIFFISFTVYVASAFNAGTAVFCSVLPWFNAHKELAMLIFALLILVYTFLGGFKAVCWTDFFQGILMLVALLAVPILMCSVGTFNNELYGALEGDISAFGANPFTADWRDIVSGLSWGLGYFGMPHILVRFMSIKKSSMIKKSAVVAIIWVILSLGAAIAIAILGRAYIMSDGAPLVETLLPGSQEKIFIYVVKDVFPPFIVGLLLSAIIAASMSTADSQLLVASASFTSDIYKPIFRKNKSSDKEILWVGRVVVLVVSLIAFFIASAGLHDATSWSANIMNMVENAWGLFGAAFGPVVLLSLFWKRFNYQGAVAGIVAGAAVDILWLVLCTGTILDTPLFVSGIYEILPGFVAGLVFSVIVSLVTPAPSEKITAIYNKATDKSIDD